MKIKLLDGTTNFRFCNDGNIHRLQAEATLIKVTLGESVADGPHNAFSFGRVEVWKMGKNGQIEATKALSKDFVFVRYTRARYEASLREGFEVLRGAELEARLLIEHGLAAEVLLGAEG